MERTERKKMTDREREAIRSVVEALGNLDEPAKEKALTLIELVALIGATPDQLRKMVEANR